MSGVRLGPYEIVGPLGSGGMGEVYRARDPRLGRDVAIKVLPSAFSGDAERLHRFEQEARAAAALNHPNILAVYDLGQHDGAPYIVSELLEGETLRERLNSGALPFRKAVDYAVQVAHGLAAAHEKGITHRDLKPENLFITSDGRVKILDFGLAKLTQPDTALAGASALPTTPPNTLPGVVLGTIGYMAPEQVRGLQADHRADIFAFGAILYEMLSGQRAFRGDTSIDMMTAILKEDPPDLPTADRNIPPALSRIVDRCLEKSPAARFKSADDLGFFLDALSTHPEARTTLGSPAPVGSSTFHRGLPWVAAVVFLGTTIVLAGVQFFRSPPAVPLVRFQVPPPTGGIFPGANNTPRMSISPDGQYLAFTVNFLDGKPDQLWIRRLDSLEARPLSNTEASPNAAEPVQQPFWSPDSRSVAFFADGRLRKVDIASGGLQTLSSMPGNNYGGTWNRDGTILFGTSLTKGIHRVSADGGSPSQVTTLDMSLKETAHLWPQFLPDGRHFLYFALGSAVEDRAVYAGSIESNERKLVLKSEYMVGLAPPGYLFFMRDGALMAQRFDVEALELQGEPIQMAEGVQGARNGRVAVTVSETGVLVFRPGAGTAGVDSQLVWFDRAGKQLGTVGTPFSYRGVELSPDGLQAAVHREERERTGDLWVLDLQRGSTARFTFDATQHNMSPIWSPDGRRIFFSRNAGTTWGIYERDSSGVGGETLLYETKDLASVTPLSVSPDGQSLVFRVTNQLSLADLSVLALSGERKASPYLQNLRNLFNQSLGQLSPDGRWMAYATGESARLEIYVQSFPSLGTRYQVSTAGGFQPRWRRDGKELFYLTAGPSASSSIGSMVSVSVDAAGVGLRFGIPEALFDSYAIFPTHAAPVFNYSVTPDGKRFLVARQLAAANANPAETPLTVVLNWPALLKK